MLNALIKKNSVISQYHTVSTLSVAILMTVWLLTARAGAQISIPEPLPSLMPEAPQLDGTVAKAVRRLFSTKGVASGVWVSPLQAEFSVNPLLDDGWQWRGGVSVLDDNMGVGGFSGIEAEWQIGGTLSFVAISDAGTWVGGRIGRQSLGNYDSLSLTEPSVIQTRPGARPRQSQTNPEAIALDQAGHFLLAFEGDHRVQKHGSIEQRPSVLPVPTALRSAATNRGIEALAVLPDGRYFAVGEDFDPTLGYRAWLWAAGDAANWQTLAYQQSFEDGFAWTPTAAAVMDDRMLVVERWWDGGFRFRSRLVGLPLTAVRPGALLQPEVVMELTPLAGSFANIEGLSVVPSPRGWLALFVSDNQRLSLLPTVLFVLEKLD